jgi:hypothetical protein
MNRPSKIDLEDSVPHSGLAAEYAAELSQLQEICSQYVTAFPPCLRQVGKRLIQSCADRWQSAEWVLPLALGDAWYVPQVHSQAIAAANALTALQVQVQRDAEDRPTRGGDLLPLGPLLYTRALRQYQQLFPPASDFWTLLEGYHLEWSEAVLWERQRQWRSVRRYSQEDILRLAGGRAWLKIGCAAVALLAGKRQILMPLGGVLDHLHIAVHLMDDIVNWKVDLQARRATYFLTQVALALNVREMATLGRLNLVDLLATGSLPHKVIRQALQHLSTAKKVADHLENPALVTYLDDLETACTAIPHQLEHDLASAPSVERTRASVSI